MKALLLILIINSALTYAEGTSYKIEYDYAGHGDDWYGKPGPITPRTDFYQDTDILTQQGDDFCQGYEASLVHLGQGPEMMRTQDSHTAYTFKHTGGTRCLSYIPPISDLIFKNSFE